METPVIVNIQRDPDCRWQERPCREAPTLRTYQKSLWACPRGIALRGRYIMPVELLALQEFPVRRLRLTGLTDNELAFGAGNAMTVSVMAALILEVLRVVDRQRMPGAFKPYPSTQRSRKRAWGEGILSHTAAEIHRVDGVQHKK